MSIVKPTCKGEQRSGQQGRKDKTCTPCDKVTEIFLQKRIHKGAVYTVSMTCRVLIAASHFSPVQRHLLPGGGKIHPHYHPSETNPIFAENRDLCTCQSPIRGRQVLQHAAFPATAPSELAVRPVCDPEGIELSNMSTGLRLLTCLPLIQDCTILVGGISFATL
jgi:hypothetical protein